MSFSNLKKQAGFTIIEGLVCLSIVGIFGAVAYQAIKDPQGFADSLPGENKAARALDDAGVTNVQLGSRNYYACAQDDTMGIEFSGTNVRGKQVQGVVCMDTMKGSTIRYK